jgi:hypothetical protein
MNKTFPKAALERCGHVVPEFVSVRFKRSRWGRGRRPGAIPATKRKHDAWRQLKGCWSKARRFPRGYTVYVPQSFQARP